MTAALLLATYFGAAYPVHPAVDADAARHGSRILSFWSFMALLFGAVAATLAGILGGDLRDEL